MSPSDTRLPLACTVRSCVQPLERRHRAWVCAAGHSYDIARSGYVNLLQPQDRRSRAAGDSKAAIEARAALLTAGLGRALIAAVVSRVTTASTIVDLGCGSGDALAALTETRTGIGIDLSIVAVDRAARRFPDRTWVVANADRRLPLLDGSIDLVISLHGRRNPPEVARVLEPQGSLLIAVPAADDLIELRELVQGERIARDRGESVVAEHQSWFDVVDRSVVRDDVELDRDRLLDLLHGTYRGGRRASADRIAALTRMAVTTASDLFLLRLR